jgi:hypothetical protein
MKIKFFVILILIGFVTICGTMKLYAFIIGRTVKPVQDFKDVVLTKPLYDMIGQLDEGAKKLVYTAYVAGFLDALQLEEVGAVAIKEFSQKCEGMTLGQLTDTISKFYEENPDLRNVRPADILINWIPRLKNGLPLKVEEGK